MDSLLAGAMQGIGFSGIITLIIFTFYIFDAVIKFGKIKKKYPEIVKEFEGN